MKKIRFADVGRKVFSWTKDPCYRYDPEEPIRIRDIGYMAEENDPQNFMWSVTSESADKIGKTKTPLIVEIEGTVVQNRREYRGCGYNVPSIRCGSSVIYAGDVVMRPFQNKFWDLDEGERIRDFNKFLVGGSEITAQGILIRSPLAGYSIDLGALAKDDGACYDKWEGYSLWGFRKMRGENSIWRHTINPSYSPRGEGQSAIIFV